ncbi:MAG: ROK family transcriptional regulator [Rhizobiaceae bacterium]|nr:ROK family transcriptional regulator [Rhizobiaceae bacterium]
MTVGIRHDDLRRRNRALVLTALRTADRRSRTEIANLTGLSNSTISAITSRMIEEGVLLEFKGNDNGPGRRGRPQVALSLNPKLASVVAVTLTLDHVSATLIDYAGQPVDEEAADLITHDLDRQALIDAVVGCVRKVVSRQGEDGYRPARIALAVQGITSSDSSSLLWSPITPIENTRFAPALTEAFGIPATVENDCNMITVALKWREPERYRKDFFAVMLSDGIGMGLMLKGELFSGTQSSGGEFGHMIHIPDGALCRCGKQGCIEAYAGNYALIRNATGGHEDDPPGAVVSDVEIQKLADAARAVDGPERAAFLKAGRAIGFGLGSLFAVFDPAPVAIVGPGAHAFDILEEPIRDAIERTAGGKHSSAISFDTEPDEMPLMREGCAMTALTKVDAEIVAPGAMAEQIGRQVA